MQIVLFLYGKIDLEEDLDMHVLDQSQTFCEFCHLTPVYYFYFVKCI